VLYNIDKILYHFYTIDKDTPYDMGVFSNIGHVPVPTFMIEPDSTYNDYIVYVFNPHKHICGFISQDKLYSESRKLPLQTPHLLGSYDTIDELLILIRDHLLTTELSTREFSAVDF
jgi:hypothetical protein